MAESGNADLIAEGRTRRVAVDITRLEPKTGTDTCNAEIEGEILDSGDLAGIQQATLKIEGTGEFKVDFSSPTKFSGVFIPPANE
jgi:hypothetical protein